MRKRIVSLTFIMLSILLFAAAGYAKPFYQGRVIKMIVATKPGGGYDYYARLLSQFMQKYLPGSTFIVKNMPGAGHVIGSNAVYKSKPNGLTLGTFNRAVGITQVAGIKGVRFDFPKFSWLGSPSSELYCYIVHKDFKNLDDVLQAKDFRISTSGVGSIAYLTALLFYQMIGQTNYSIGTGYAGSETDLAILRKEMDGTFGSFHSRKQMVDQGFGRIVMLIGESKPPGYEDVPYIEKIVKEKKHQAVITLLKGINLVGRPFAGPPGIPADRLKILRDAFKKAVKDPALLKHAKKADRPINFVDPKKVEVWSQSLMQLAPDMVATIKKAYGTK
jgi:tripartite-type tricarboxylate transporter receptor subunit TctC